MELCEKVVARGHPNVSATHATTIEITKDRYLTTGGDCVIAIDANKGFPEFSRKFKKMAKDPKTKITVKISVNDLENIITGWGDPSLTFGNPNDLVIRKSEFICDRTLMVRADTAAADLDRELVKKLQSEDAIVKIKICVKRVP